MSDWLKGLADNLVKLTPRLTHRPYMLFLTTGQSDTSTLLLNNNMSSPENTEEYVFYPADFSDPRVPSLFQAHHAYCNAEDANFPGAKTYALDLGALQKPGIQVWTIWTADSQTLLGCGALKVLPNGLGGEIKAMNTVADARGKGIGGLVLDKLIIEARKLNLNKIWLETGTMPAFAPARKLYQRGGFQACEPYGDYFAQENSVFMSRDI